MAKVGMKMSEYNIIDCPQCGSSEVYLYILIPRKGYTAVSVECRGCGREVKSGSVHTLGAMKKHCDFIDRMEREIVAKWNAGESGNDDKEELVKTVTGDEFEGAILKPGVKLVFFGEEDCLPCDAMTPTIDSLSVEYNGKVDFYRVDTETEKGLCRLYEVATIPRILIFFGGEVVQEWGVCSKKALSAALNEYTERAVG